MKDFFWQGGYKLLRTDMASTGLSSIPAMDRMASGHSNQVSHGDSESSGSSVQLRSTVCVSASRSESPSGRKNPNRATVSFDKFDPLRNIMVADLGVSLSEELAQVDGQTFYRLQPAMAKGVADSATTPPHGAHVHHGNVTPGKVAALVTPVFVSAGNGTVLPNGNSCFAAETAASMGLGPVIGDARQSRRSMTNTALRSKDCRRRFLSTAKESYATWF
jgi:hypothetical protein